MRTSMLARLLCLFLVGAVSLAGCGKSAPEVVTEPPLVTVSKPIESMVPDYQEYPGRTAAVESVEVRARVTGFLDDVAFQEGAEVRKGDILFEIDPRPYKAELAKQVGQINLAKARYRLAQADYDRARDLQRTPGAISPQEIQTYEAKAAEAGAALDAAKGAAETARLNVEFCTVHAPISGQASRTQLTKGNLVTADSTLLTTIVSQQPMYANFDVDERTLLEVREQLRKGKFTPSGVKGKEPALDKGKEPALDVATIAGLLAAPFGHISLVAALPAPPGQKQYSVVELTMRLSTETEFGHKGHINFVNNQVDPSTGTISVRGLFPNDKRILTPGLFARVRVPIGDPRKSLLVSERAIGTNQGQKFVYVVDDKDEVVSRTVTLGALRDGLRVITEGIKRDDRIIINGLQRVQPGVTVKVKEGKMEPETRGWGDGAEGQDKAKDTKRDK
ncbi:MAG TPA: efflux RND transporter periplasmic adaptor subunit [Gemmataceae bacterium]|nr:efflux RND transporter periplasmic adaptor subunit [Gemmataceae bacterium]